MGVRYNNTTIRLSPEGVNNGEYTVYAETRSVEVYI